MKELTPRQVLENNGSSPKEHFLEYAEQYKFKYASIRYIIEQYYKEYPQMETPDTSVKEVEQTESGIKELTLKQKQVIAAYVFLRQNNHSLPDDILDYLKDAGMNYDDLQEENTKLKESNKELTDIAKRIAFMLGNEANYPEGTMGYQLAKDAEKAISNNIS